MERGRRIELLALAWKAKVLPLYEPRIDLAPQDGIEPPTFWLTARRNYRCATEEYILVPGDGLEPPTSTV